MPSFDEEASVKATDKGLEKYGTKESWSNLLFLIAMKYGSIGGILLLARNAQSLLKKHEIQPIIY